MGTRFFWDFVLAGRHRVAGSNCVVRSMFATAALWRLIPVISATVDRRPPGRDLLLSWKRACQCDAFNRWRRFKLQSTQS